MEKAIIESVRHVAKWRNGEMAANGVIVMAAAWRRSKINGNNQ
jgi:hypothetical protein